MQDYTLIDYLYQRMIMKPRSNREELLLDFIRFNIHKIEKRKTAKWIIIYVLWLTRNRWEGDAFIKLLSSYRQHCKVKGYKAEETHLNKIYGSHYINLRTWPLYMLEQVLKD